MRDFTKNKYIKNIKYWPTSLMWIFSYVSNSFLTLLCAGPKQQKQNEPKLKHIKIMNSIFRVWEGEHLFGGKLWIFGGRGDGYWKFDVWRLKSRN